MKTKYSDGNEVPKDWVKAIKCFRKAAEQGNAEVQHILGACYHAGTGVTEDLTKSAQWFRKAAEQGDARAQHSLDLVLCAQNSRN